MIKSNKMVKDFEGKLIPRNKARSISGAFYEEGTSCFLMPDDLWYRITSPKIVLDNYTKQYVLKTSGNLIEGFVGKNKLGFFSVNDFTVSISSKKNNIKKIALNEEVAIENGYIESLNNGIFYDASEITEKDKLEWFNVKTIPSSERSSEYNLESNQQKKKQLENSFKNLDIRISREAKEISNVLGDKTFGVEWEIVNGFLPKRIRYQYGVKALKDGSLRDGNSGKEGMELVSVPMNGSKGVQAMLNIIGELNKRCEVNNLCALHFHFGNVRKDKLYVLSLYKLVSMIQNELYYYFPYCRFNSVRGDGKLYCKFFEDKSIDYNAILNCKNEESFDETVKHEFDKIYSWLNRGHHLGETYGPKTKVREVVYEDGKKLFCEKWLSNIYSTKSTHHALEGNQKWDKVERYFIVNFLNLFFSKTGTIEFRCHEGTLNKTKTVNWFITCLAILKYAENIKSVFSANTLNLSDVLNDSLGKEKSKYLMSYFKSRRETFFATSGYKRNITEIEKKWFLEDNNYTFKKEDSFI